MTRHTISLLLFVAVLLGDVLWWNRRDPIHGIHSRTAMASALQQALPLGMSLERAQVHMERHGFACEAMMNADWLQSKEPGSPGPASQVTRRNIDFVLCQREGTDWVPVYLVDPVRVPFPVAEYWRIGLVHSEGVLAEILVSHSRRKERASVLRTSH